jgi:hypothetical protein
MIADPHLHAAAVRSTTVDAENPWPGLLAYREADQEFFHGREHEADELSRLVMRSPLTILFGRSGLGKTSLLQAGLFPRLREQNVLPIYVRLGFSADDPSLSGQIRQAIALEATAALVEAPVGRAEDTLWEVFHRRDADFWNERNRLMLPLLVLDQFEEVFTLGRSDAVRATATAAFLAELGDLIEGRPPRVVKEHLDAYPAEAGQFSFGRHHYKVLLSLREDFIPELEGLRARTPSIAHNRMRLERLDGAGAREVVACAGILIEPRVADQVVRFVAAAPDEDSPLEGLELEPALLSVVCRELNARRQQRGERRISEALLKGSREEILSEFYEHSVSDLTAEVRVFVEDRLLTVSGHRDSVALENALNHPGVTPDVITQLVDRRVLRVEEHAGVPRLELTHDLLTGVIAASRQRRRHAEEEARREREIAELERRTRLEERAKRARLFLASSVVMALLLVLALWAAFEVWRQRRQADLSRARAEQQQVEAEQARERAERQRVVATQLYERMADSVRLRQAVLSRDPDSVAAALERMPLEKQVRFTATAREYPYKAVGGLPTYKFQLLPVEQSVPGGLKSIALITYIMNHPTFLNPLISTAPDTRFTGTYDGVGCLSAVTAVIEYTDLGKPLAIAKFDMCELLRSR